jgi:dynein light chain Tctex-type 1
VKTTYAATHTHTQVTFIPENVEPICYTAIEAVLKDKMYNESMVQKWVDEICASITKELVEMNKPFKYLVSAVVMQKNGAGLHQAYSCYWDNAIDNTIVAKWPSEKKKDPNARMVCIVTVFGVAF